MPVDIDRYRDAAETYESEWAIADSVVREMCRKYPRHNDLNL